MAANENLVLRIQETYGDTRLTMKGIKETMNKGTSSPVSVRLPKTPQRESALVLCLLFL